MCNHCVRAGRQFGKHPAPPVHFFTKEEIHDLLRNANARSKPMLAEYGKYNCIVNAKTTSESLDDAGPQVKYILSYHDANGVCIGEGELTFTPTDEFVDGNPKLVEPDVKVGQPFVMKLEG